MHLFKIYPKSIETIKLFQEKLLNNEFYDDRLRDGIFSLKVEDKILIVSVTCYNASECYIIDENDNLIDCFVISEFSNLKYKGKTLEERYNEVV